MEELNVTVDTANQDTEERFVREYVVPAVQRLGDSYEIIFYGRYSTSTSVEGGRVKIVFKGDPDEILAEEEERLNAFEYIDEWESEIESDEGETRMSENEQEFMEQCGRAAARMNVHYFEEFDERPPTGSVTGERFHTRGMWTLVHFLLNEQGYSPEEEVDILFLALRDRLARLGVENDFERVEEEVAGLHDRLDETETRIDETFFAE